MVWCIWLLVFGIRKEISIQSSLSHCHFQVVDILKTSGSPDLFSPELDAGEDHLLDDNQLDNHQLDDLEDNNQQDDHDHGDSNGGDDGLADIDMDHS